MFTAKKTIPEKITNVEAERISIVVNKTDKTGTVSFNNSDDGPIDLLSDEYTALQDVMIKVAARCTEFSDVLKS